CMQNTADDHELVGDVGREVAVEGENVGGRREWIGHEAAGDDRTHGVEPVLERRHHAEVASSAAYAPEEVVILVRARGQYATVGGHHLGRDEVVEREPVLRHEPADAAAEREAGNTGRGDDASGHG